LGYEELHGLAVIARRRRRIAWSASQFGCVDRHLL